MPPKSYIPVSYINARDAAEGDGVRSLSALVAEKMAAAAPAEARSHWLLDGVRTNVFLADEKLRCFCDDPVCPDPDGKRSAQGIIRNF